jgi:hypothetical protein
MVGDHVGIPLPICSAKLSMFGPGLQWGTTLESQVLFSCYFLNIKEPVYITVTAVLNDPKFRIVLHGTSPPFLRRVFLVMVLLRENLNRKTHFLLFRRTVRNLRRLLGNLGLLLRGLGRHLHYASCIL